MAFQYLKAKVSILPHIFSPTLSAIFSTLPLWQRWRMLLLQPITILGTLLTSPYWLFNNRYSVIYVPTRSGKRRCLVYQPPSYHTEKEDGDGKRRQNRLRPLHIDIHGGAFIGGFPEQSTRFCALLSDCTGAVVVSCTYRVAPKYIYPAAHDDIDDIVMYLIRHAEELGADSKLLTISGSSVGGGLALSASQHLYYASQTSGNRVRVHMPLAYVAFYPAVDLRRRPEEKPKPPNYPTSDPLAFLLPMYDIYAGTHRTKLLEDPRLHPILAPKETLPKDVLVVAAGIDILLHEQLTMIERIKGELEDEGDTERRVEMVVVEKGFHGFVELPSFVMEKERLEVFERSVDFVRQAHRKAGFTIERKQQ